MSPTTANKRGWSNVILYRLLLNAFFVHRSVVGVVSMMSANAIHQCSGAQQFWAADHITRSSKSLQTGPMQNAIISNDEKQETCIMYFNELNTLFTLIIYFNMTGILPYMFSTTSHIIITLSIGLPVWLLLLIRRITFSPKKTIGHLLPDRAPAWLSEIGGMCNFKQVQTCSDAVSE